MKIPYVLEGDKLKEIIKLIKYYLIFFKIGLLTIGGGYLMLPIMEKELVNKRSMIEYEELVNSFAMAQSIPGVIAVNTAAFIGYKLDKIKGVVATVLGVITPSIIIISIISVLYVNMADNEYINKLLHGVRVAVVALLLVTIYKMIKTTVKDKIGLILMLVSLLAITVVNISPVRVILAGCIISGFIYTRKRENHVT